MHSDSVAMQACAVQSPFQPPHPARRIKINTRVKGGGQECPPYTNKGSPQRDSFAAAASSSIHNNFPSEGCTLCEGSGGVFLPSSTLCTMSALSAPLAMNIT